MTLSPFHLALPVKDLDSTRHFYGGLLQCREGRSTASWVDFDFFGHQVSFHMRPHMPEVSHSPVDSDDVPIPHFGAVLETKAWHTLAERLTEAGVDFIIEPKTRFQGEAGEQSTMFFADPSGNHLEFKSVADLGQLFAT